MRITKLRAALRAKRNLMLWGLLLSAVTAFLLLYRLGTLVPGLSLNELHTVRTPLGWHGLYEQPFYLPLKLIRSVVFFIFADHGQLLTRLPNALFGGLSILAFAGVVRLWHGTRTAVLATLLFACGAWILHSSRLASFDVLYLWAMPSLLLTYTFLHKQGLRALVWYGSLAVWGLLLYIPGLVWIILFGACFQRQALADGWHHFARWWQRLFSVLIFLAWLPLLIIDLLRPGHLMSWLGLPEHLAAGTALIKQIAAVPFHLFVYGPQYPELWLDRAPLLDVFTLVLCLLGIYFYARHFRASRSRLLGGLFIIGIALVGIGGPVSFALVVPLMYFAAATGLAYLLREWLRVFPNNPLGRSLGISLIIAAVSLSCIYNVRAYFVAWPHTAVTRATFHYHP